MDYDLLNVWDREYKKGFLSYLVLLMVKDQPGYGYEIFRKLSDKMNLQISSVYHVLNRMERKRLVEFQWMISNKGPKRKYYSITENGEKLIEKFTFKSIIPIMETVNGLIDKHYLEPTAVKGDETNEIYNA